MVSQREHRSTHGVRGPLGRGSHAARCRSVPATTPLRHTPSGGFPLRQPDRHRTSAAPTAGRAAAGASRAAGEGQGQAGRGARVPAASAPRPTALRGRRIRPLRLSGAARAPGLRWAGPGRAGLGWPRPCPAAAANPRGSAQPAAARSRLARVPPTSLPTAPPGSSRFPASACPRFLPPARCFRAAVVPGQASLPAPAAPACPRPVPPRLTPPLGRSPCPMPGGAAPRGWMLPAGQHRGGTGAFNA